MPKTSVKVTVDLDAIEAIKVSSEARSFVLDKAEEAATALRRAVPVRTGAARASISADAVLTSDGWTGVASWDTQHYYVGILNSRRGQPDAGWADRAAASVRYV